MDTFFQSIESENNSLSEQVTDFEAEILRLNQENSVLEKALENQKKFHRKYAEDAVVSETFGSKISSRIKVHWLSKINCWSKKIAN